MIKKLLILRVQHAQVTIPNSRFEFRNSFGNRAEFFEKEV